MNCNEFCTKDFKFLYLNIQEEQPLVEEPMPTLSYTEPPNVGYKAMPLTPSYVLPPAQTFATNLPTAYFSGANSRFPVFAWGECMHAPGRFMNGHIFFYLWMKLYLDE